MKKITKLIIIIIVITSGSIVYLWSLAGKWMAEGVTPVADGENNYAIILGAKVNGEIPSLTLQNRLNAALAYGKEHQHVIFILSGGQGADEAISEAEAMERFLLANGISEDRLILEDQSTSTYENLLFAKELLPSTVEQVTIISSDFHLARAQKIAQRLELNPDVVAATTPKVVESKLRIRERLALIKTAVVGK